MSASEDTYPVRKLSIDFAAKSNRYWFKNRPFETHWFNALSFGIVPAERFAISCIKDSLPLVQEETLKAEARAFIGQESTHSFLHAKCNAELERQGYRFFLHRYCEWRLSKAHWLSRLSGLALTACWEHITAIICEHTLSRFDIFKDADDPFCALWTWHSAEELEHKCLAHDLYVGTAGGYPLKIGWLLYGTALFVTDFATQTAHNMYRDGRLFDPRVWLGCLRYFFGRQGLFWFALPRWLAFMHPRFHPGDVDNRALSAFALEQLKTRLKVVGPSVASHGAAD
jgi:predicted metal-dependent hydrolase